MTQLTPDALPRRVHFLGVGGAGVSGVARILLARGHRLSGHDRAKSGVFDALESLDFALELGPSTPEALPADAELVIRSAAVPADDPQVLEAEARHVPVRKYADVLPALAPPAKTLAVAGTHGKTTTGWMLWHALEGVGGLLRAPVPGGLVGGLDRRLQTNALAGSRGGWFAVEACEYDRTFLKIAPYGAIVTNVEGEHLDYYLSLDAVETAFARFVAGVNDGGLVVLGRDVPARVEEAAAATVWRLGRELEIDLVGERAGFFRFRLRGPGWATPEIALGVPGSFNVENAALACALAIGIHRGSDPARLAAAAAEGIERFLGVARRFESWGGDGAGVDVVHDYAHHPTEVRVTIEAARRAFPRREIHVLFQPHQHSRTARFLNEFVESLRAADRVVVADVYGARTHVDGTRFAGAAELVDGLKSIHVAAVQGGPLGSAVQRFAEGVKRPACVLVLGAGDVEHVRDELLQKLALRSPAPGAARS